jgi:hypothetical protein
MILILYKICWESYPDHSDGYVISHVVVRYNRTSASAPGENSSPGSPR